MNLEELKKDLKATMATTTEHEELIDVVVDAAYLTGKLNGLEESRDKTMETLRNIGES